MYDPNIGRLFTSYTMKVGGSATVYSVKQQVEDKGLVTVTGSAKYQGIGYDGPHSAGRTGNSIDDIRFALRDHGIYLTGTIFADIAWMYSFGSLPDGATLQDLIDDWGWDLAVHFRQDWSIPSEIDQYQTITGWFGGTTPTSW